VASRTTRTVWRALAEVEGFAEGCSIFGGDDDPAYFVNGTQVANLVDDDLALRLTRKVISTHRPQLKADERVDLLRSGSDWIGVRLTSVKDLPFVLELAERAAEAHRPPPGVSAKPPPTGADLARRRRFH
jgi:hypothetical protein